ncbi:type 1 glutamine amidotransferase [Jatrophihabitans sp. DSM 45814]
MPVDDSSPATGPDNVRRPILVVENDVTDPVGRLGDWLTDGGAMLDIRSMPDGAALPESLDDFGGLVVMGGAQNVYDDDVAPWLPQLRALLAAAVQSEVPTLGVCLGGQLLAVAVGGRVGLAETPEYGAQLIAKRQAAADDVLFKELPITPDVLQWHVDEITQLPPRSVLLASSPGGEVQAFRVGRRAWGLQFHIETSPETITAWAEDDAAALADYDVERIVDRSIAAHDDIAEVWQPFAARFAAVVADPALAATPRGLPMASSSVPTSVAGPVTDPAEIRAALAAQMQAARGSHGH